MPRNSNLNSTPVTRSLQGARARVNAPSRSANLRQRPAESLSKTASTREKPVRTSKRSARIVSFVDAKSKALRPSLNASSAPTHARSAQHFAPSQPARGRHASGELQKPTGERNAARIQAQGRLSSRAKAALMDDLIHEKEEPKPSKSRLSSLVENKKSKAAENRRKRSKAKADKKFDKTYGGSVAVKEQQQTAPRAALYSTKMGSSHKKSSKMQTKDVRDIASQSAGIIGDKVSKLSFPKLPKALTRFAAIAVVCAIFCVGLYVPAQQYYVQMRETDRLEAEYIEVAERTNNLADSIDALQTDEGVEDKAHSELGYVKSGEESATVKGIAQANLSDLPTSNVAPGSIPAPDTWYSGALDAFFGYEGSSSQ